jgi:triacylglycerol lipase
MNSVVLVHGIFNTSNVFKKMSGFLETLGYKTYAPTLRPNSGSSGLDELARQLRMYIDATIPAEEKFYLIGFSILT